MDVTEGLRAPYAAQSPIVTGVVSPNRPLPARFADPVWVVLGDLSPDHSQPMEWAPIHGSTLPAVGAEVLVVYDAAGIPRVVWWEGVTVFPPPPAGGLQVFRFTQAAASATWTIPHNLGSNPASVTFYDNTGTEFDCAWSAPDVNTVVATLALPVAGSAVVVAGSAAQVFVQTAPAASWGPFNHNLGRLPVVTLYDALGANFDAAWSADGATVTVGPMVVAAAGKAVVA